MSNRTHQTSEIRASRAAAAVRLPAAVYYYVAARAGPI
jgi:hypothetical protein